VVLRALGLGDLLTAVPALRALRRHHPEHRILLAAPAVLGPLATLTGAVDETVDTAPLAPLEAQLHGADVAVNLHGRGPQSHAVLRAARPRRLVAFADPATEAAASDGAGAAGAAAHMAAPRWRADEHEVVRWCRMLEAHGIPADPRDLLLPRPDAATPEDARGAVLLHPGAASGARRWPVERFAAVARGLTAQGTRVLVTGGAGEAALAAAVVRQAGLPDEASVAGRTGLPGLLALVADAACVVCGDTGVAHVATAMSTPSVLLFGPTPPDHWGPLVGRGAGAARPRHAVLWAGGTGDPHAEQPDPGLLRIGTDEVLQTVAEVRDPAAAARR
jgi:ADP-heptose:LPS heptosyltransferase